MTEQEFKKVRVGDIVFFHSRKTDKIEPCLVEKKEFLGVSVFTIAEFTDGFGYQIPYFLCFSQIERTSKKQTKEQIERARQMKSLWKKVGKERTAYIKEKEKEARKKEEENKKFKFDRWWDWKFKYGDWSDYEK